MQREVIEHSTFLEKKDAFHIFVDILAEMLALEVSHLQLAEHREYIRGHFHNFPNLLYILHGDGPFLSHWE